MKNYNTININGELFNSNGTELCCNFKWFLELEKKRNQRTGGAVCAVYIDFSEVVKNNEKSQVWSPLTKTWEKILKLIISDIRDSDLIFVYDKEIRLIIANTEKEGAVRVSQRIFDLIQSRLKKQNKITAVEIKIHIWDYKSKLKYESVIFNKKQGSDTCKPIETLI